MTLFIGEVAQIEDRARADVAECVAQLGDGELLARDYGVLDWTSFENSPWAGEGTDGEAFKLYTRTWAAAWGRAYEAQQAAVREVRDVLDGVTVMGNDGEECVSYGECFLAVSQDLDGTIPLGVLSLDYHGTRERAQRVWADHRAMVGAMFDRALVSPLDFVLV